MIEVFCVMEQPGEDDFLVLLRKKDSGEWGGVEMADGARPAPAVEQAVGVRALHLWPLCDRVRQDPVEGDRRNPERLERTHLGAVLGDGDLLVDGAEWAVVAYDDAAAMVPEGDRRILSLARQGAWIHKAGQLEA